jgi:iron-sulfur cluster repair protein YtfE (RIC family)
MRSDSTEVLPFTRTAVSARRAIHMPDNERIQSWIDHVADRTREALREELTKLVDNITSAVAEEQVGAVHAARRAAEAAAALQTSQTMAAERQAAEQRLNEALAAAQGAAEQRLNEAVAAAREAALAERPAPAESPDTTQAAERDAMLAETSALLESMRALDECTTISAILEALARTAGRYTSRVAVLVRKGDQLTGSAWSGFPDWEGARSFASPLDGAGIAGSAVKSGQRQTTAGRQNGGAPLSPTRDDRAALAIPLRVGGDVVGVLYADNDGEGADVPSPWPELVEALVRHAERCLESATIRALPELFRAGATERARRLTERQDDESAQRYARLLVAEIRLYHESLLEEAKRDRNVLRKLRPQIERAQQLYAERVPAELRSRTTYFEQELVRTLADGDPGLLGQAT